MEKLFSQIPVLKGERLTLRALTQRDADGLRELTQSSVVYRFLPAILFEKKYDDAEYVISRLYDECIKNSLILGVFMDDSFCGIAEIYGYRESDSKVSVGCRLLPKYWGEGIALEMLGLVVDYILKETDIEIIGASMMSENKASAGVLEKGGFECVACAVPEDWGFSEPTPADNWVLTRSKQQNTEINEK